MAQLVRAPPCHGGGRGFEPHPGRFTFTSLPQSSLELAESLEQLRWLENGYSIKVGISDVETIGIDTPQDLARAEEFLRNQQEAL